MPEKTDKVDGATDGFRVEILAQIKSAHIDMKLLGELRYELVGIVPVDTEIAKKGFRDWTPSMRNEAVLKHLSPKETLQEAVDMTDQKQRYDGLFDVLGITDLRLIRV